MFVGEKDAVQFVRREAAKLEPEDELARAQAAIDQEPAMLGRDQGAVPGAPAPEHCQTKHVRYLANRSRGHKRKRDLEQISTAPVLSDTVWMQMDAIDLAGLRREYDTVGLRRAEMHADPIEQFATWFSTAVNSELPDANAMTLATATPDGRPSARIVLLKAFDHGGFVFFTNHNSDKGREIEANPRAALAFYWVQLERQVRIAGRVEKSSRQESEEYFRSRPRGSQLGAWVSHQSEVIDARRILDARLAEMEVRFADKDVIDLPPHWGGYRVIPDEMEFWQGRANRLHDRFRYTLEADGSWKLDRLAP
jgi:pyridoxamine 5'-phosphate oxidase